MTTFARANGLPPVICWRGQRSPLAATSAQWALQRAALLTPMMESANLGGVVLIVAGPLSGDVAQACLLVVLPIAALLYSTWSSSQAPLAMDVGSARRVTNLPCGKNLLR